MDKFSSEIVKYSDILASKAWVDSAMLVGSVIDGKEEPNDLDLLVTTLVPRTKEKIINVFSEQPGYVGYAISDDAIRFAMEGENLIPTVSIAPQYRSHFFTYLRKLIEGKHTERINKPRAVGGYIPEILLYDISRAHILFDKSGDLTQYQDHITTDYPAKLQNSLSATLEEEIKNKSQYYVDASRNTLAHAMLMSDLFIAAARLVYAQNGKYFPGLKRLQADPAFQLLQESPLDDGLPIHERLQGRKDAIASHMGTPSDDETILSSAEKQHAR